MKREEAINFILDKHGVNSIYVFTTGFISRTGYKLCKDEYVAFYMQGSMGMAPAIGLGIALSTDKDVVVVNGDGALLMSLGTTHTLREYAPDNFYHYVLNNNSYESVGEQSCTSLENRYVGVTKVFNIELGGKDERVDIEVVQITANIKSFLEK